MVFLVATSIVLYSSFHCTDLRTIWSGELAVERVTVIAIVETEIERMFLTVSRQVLNEDKLFLGSSLRLMTVHFRYVCTTVHVREDVIASLVGVCEVETQGIFRDITVRINNRRLYRQFRFCR